LSTIGFIAAIAALVAVAVLIRLSRLVVPLTLGLVAVLLGALIALGLGVHFAGYLAMIAFVLIVFIYFPWWPGAD
jgi:biotin transporter BioY